MNSLLSKCQFSSLKNNNFDPEQKYIKESEAKEISNRKYLSILSIMKIFLFMKFFFSSSTFFS